MPYKLQYRLINFRSAHYFANSAKQNQLSGTKMCALMNHFQNYSTHSYEIGTLVKDLERKSVIVNYK